MLIIVEGMDGSGKTTFINQLTEDLSTWPGRDERHSTNLHSSQLKEHPLKAYVHRLANYDPYDDDIICDRWHIGELIYGPLYRGRSQLTDPQRTYVDLFLQKLGAHTVLMDTPLKIVQMRIERRGEDYLQPQHHILVHDRFAEECATWDKVGPGWRSEGTVQKTLDAAQAKEVKAKRLFHFESYVGPPNPDVLILAEKRAEQRPGRPWYRQALVPYEDVSGHYLMQALNLANPSATYGIANAKEEMIPSLIDTLNVPRIVCLGAEAQAELIGQIPKYPHTRVNHPAYVKRFNAGALHEYANILKKAIDE